MYSTVDDAALPAPGFPIRRSAGQRLFSASPRLIAAVHALLRLLVPRHPPYALHILTVIGRSGLRPSGLVIARMSWPTVQFSRSGEGTEPGTPAGLSKLSSTQRAHMRTHRHRF